MKIKGYILALAALCLGLGSAFAQSDKEALVKEFESKLQQANKGVECICCDFRQTRSMAVLSKPVSKEGQFSLVLPDQMILYFNDGDYINISSEWFEMNTAGSVTSTKISSNPMLKKLGTLLSSCVSGDIDKMTEGFAYEVSNDDSGWKVVLTPVKGKATGNIARIEIVFDGKDMSISELKMVEKSSDYTLYEFYNKSFNETGSETL